MNRAWLGFGMLALACGEPGGAEAGDSGTESGDSGTESSDTGDGDGDPGDGDGDPGDGDGDGDGDGAPEGPELPPDACMVDGVLADNWNGSAWVYEDGALVQAMEWSGGENPSQTHARGDRIVVSAGQYLRVFSRSTGELVVEDFTDQTPEVQLIDALGRVYAYASEFEQIGDGILIDERNVETTLLGFNPMGALADGGWIPGAGAELGFYWPANHDFEPYLPSTTLFYDNYGNEHGQLELVESDPPQFVIAEPEHVVVLDLPALAGASQHRVVDRVGRFRTVAGLNLDGHMIAQYRIDIESQEALAIDPEPPVGYTPFACSAGASVDSTGRLVMPMTDQTVVQVMLWDPSDDSWTPLGRPYTQIGTIEVDQVGTGALGDVYEIRTFDPQTCLATLDPWPAPPAEALNGQPMQVARAGAVRSVTFATGRVVAVDPNGSCVAWIESNTIESMALSLDDELPPVELPGRAVSLE